ncbi:MAG TPA: flagellar export protein FliJ [Firmicutes bacterium]|nr:flagellar export protein FliJ [Bacillota bacterium]
MGFQFSLEKVRSYKGQIEKQRKAELSAARHRQAQEQAHLTHYRQARADGPVALGALTAADLLQDAAFCEALDERIAKWRGRVQQAEKVVRQRQGETQSAMQERKALDRLRDKKLADYRYQQARRQQHETDEVAGLRHQRKGGNDW